MATIYIVLDTRRAKVNGEYPVKLSLIHKRQTVYMSTEISALKEEFENGQLNKRAQNYQAKNAKLRKMLSDAEIAIMELSSKELINNVPMKRLRAIVEARVKGVKQNEKTFIDYLDQFSSLKANPGTRSVYNQTKVKLLDYDPMCTFETIDVSWLKKFELHMQNQGIKTNARGIHLRNIRAIFNYAIDEEITALYPFRKFKIKKEETKKRSLSVEDIIKLKNYPCEPHQEKTRDMFFLMFYLIGINPVDLFNLKHEDLHSGRIEYYRAKTGKLYSIEVIPEAMEIINKYKGKDYLIDVLEEWGNYKDFAHRMNINLKQIGEMERKGLGGKKIRTPLFPDITIYHARHTWASVAAGLDIPKETIAAGLGHEIGNRVTSIYIDFDRKKVDEANKLVAHYIGIRSLTILIEKLFNISND